MKGIIAGGSQQTVEAGAEMLRQGGNAVDAAVAAVWASFIAEAAISGPSGGGFATVCGPGCAPTVYDFFCAMPGLGREGSIPENSDFTEVSVTFENTQEFFHVGRAATAVPGNVAGLVQLLQEAGTLPPEVVLAPAIRLAREGFTLSRGQAYVISVVGENMLCYTPESAAIFAPNGYLLQSGEYFSNPALALTLEHIATEGAATLYTGDLAAQLVADHRARGGLITAQDLADYRVIKRTPLRTIYRGYTLYTNPPPSMGGILIAYILRLLEHANLRTLAHNDAEHVALLAEVMRQSDIVRGRDEPAQLLSVADWHNWLNGEHLALDWDRVATALSQGPPADSRDLPGGPNNTTHVSVIDEKGLSVGITTTPGETAGYVLGTTGLLMNNILGEAAVNPKGFHQWQPGVRIASMMAPTVVLAGDETRLVVGSGGASRICGVICQLLSNVLDWNMPLNEAVAGARVHFEHNILDLELGIEPMVADALAARGYTVTRWDEKSLYFGGPHVVGRAPDGSLTAAGDARRGGAVAVVE